jgi:tRNA-modifying protein YgfZ
VDPHDPASVPSGLLAGRVGLQVVEVTGADRLAYLDAVLSQRLRDATPGTVTSALQLDAHGAPTAVLDVVVRVEGLWLLVDEGQAPDVVPALAGRTFLQDARFAVRDDLAVVWVPAVPQDPAGTADREPAATAVASVAGTDVAAGSPPVAVEVPLRGWHVVVGADRVDALLDALVGAGASRADEPALAAAEVVLGVPRAGDEVAQGVLPEEVGLLPTHVHLDKGCYPGQEAVARMWMLGRPRRRLARVRTVGPVAAGWEAGEGRSRARITRVAGPVALAFVPPTTEVGARIEGDDGSAIEVLALVGDGVPQPGHDLAMTRRRDRRDVG